MTVDLINVLLLFKRYTMLLLFQYFLLQLLKKCIEFLHSVTKFFKRISKFKKNPCTTIIQRIRNVPTIFKDFLKLCQVIQENFQMQFNVGKCKLLHFGRTNPRNTYVMDGNELSAMEEEKDLRDLVHQSLKPSVQIAAAAKKANQVLGQVLRAFSYRDKTHSIKLFTSRVHYHLEYAIQAYSPWMVKDIEVLEAVQCRAIRLVGGLHGSYEDKRPHPNLQDCVPDKTTFQ